MRLPDVHINITGTMVAAYAAVVSSVTAVVQIANFLRDRMRLNVKVSFNRLIFGDPSRDSKQELILITATNVGRRPITVTGIGAISLYPKNNYVFMDITPNVPVELTEGKYVDALVPQDDFNLAEIRSWEAYTSIGRKVRCNQASWRKRLASDLQWRLHFRRERKKKLAANSGIKQA